MTDDIVLILPRREAQGLWELLDNGLAPKPQSVRDVLAEKRPRVPVLVQLKTVFPTVYAALEDALAEEKTPYCTCGAQLIPGGSHECPNL